MDQEILELEKEIKDLKIKSNLLNKEIKDLKIKSNLLKKELRNKLQNRKLNNDKLNLDLKLKLLDKRLSIKTIDIYISCVQEFKKYFNDQIDIEYCDIYRFITYLKEEKKLQIPSINSYISAITYYYRNVLNEKSFKLNRIYNKKNKIAVLSETEVLYLINNIKNIKHKAIVALRYFTGAKYSEIINLKLQNINLDANTIIYENKVNRESFIDKELKDILKEYIEFYKPDFYFFKGTNQLYSQRSIDIIFKNNIKAYTKVNHNILIHSRTKHLILKHKSKYYIKSQLGYKFEKLYNKIKTQ